MGGIVGGLASSSASSSSASAAASLGQLTNDGRHPPLAPIIAWKRKARKEDMEGRRGRVMHYTFIDTHTHTYIYIRVG